MKKIGFDARLWNESGVGRYIRNLIFRYDDLIDDFELVVFLNSEVFDEVKLKNPRIKKIISKAKWHSLKEQIIFKKELDQQEFDLVHFPYFSYPVFYKKPFVITIHDLIIDHYPTGKASSLPFPFYYAKHYAYKKMTAAAVKNSEKIIVPSYATRDELIDHYKAKTEKIDVIYEGFDTSIYKESLSHTSISQKQYILYVGNAYPHKNLQVLLEAFLQLRKKNVEIELVCIGRKDFFYDRIEKEKYPGVHFFHDVDDKNLFEYYRGALCLVMPSLMEGFGLPVLEAMSLSTPVICSHIPALKEIAQDAALYFDPKNALDLEEKILLLINGGKEASDLRERGRSRARQFSWKKCVEQTVKLYESCDSIRQGK